VPPDPVGDFPQQLLEALGELLVCGLRDVDGPVIQQWRETTRCGEAAGLPRLSGLARSLTERLEAKLSTPRWDPSPARDALFHVAALAKLAADLA